MQALAARAKVSKHPNIQKLVATYKDQDFICIVCELYHGTRLFSAAEVQDGCATSGSSKHFSCCQQYSVATSKVHCFFTSEVSLNCSYAAKTGAWLQELAIATSLVTLSGSGIAPVVLRPGWKQVRFARLASTMIKILYVWRD